MRLSMHCSKYKVPMCDDGLVKQRGVSAGWTRPWALNVWSEARILQKLQQLTENDASSERLSVRNHQALRSTPRGELERLACGWS